MEFKIEGKINIPEKELREYGRKELGEDYKEKYTWNKLAENYLVNIDDGKTFFMHLNSIKEFKI